MENECLTNLWFIMNQIKWTKSINYLYLKDDERYVIDLSP